MTIRRNDPSGMQVDAGWMQACTKGAVSQNKRFVSNPGDERTAPSGEGRRSTGTREEGGKSTSVFSSREV